MATSQDRYQAAHSWRARQRARFAPGVAAGLFVCPFCGRTIEPGEPWDLDHERTQLQDPESVLDPTNVRPSHRRCNRRSGARERNRRMARQRRLGLVVPPPPPPRRDPALDSTDYDDPRCPRHLAYVPCARCLADE